MAAVKPLLLTLYGFPFHCLKSHCLFSADPALGFITSWLHAPNTWPVACMGSGCKSVGSGPLLLTVDDISLELQNGYVATPCYWKRHKCLVSFRVIPACVWTTLWAGVELTNERCWVSHCSFFANVDGMLQAECIHIPQLKLPLSFSCPTWIITNNHDFSLSLVVPRPDSLCIV